MRLDPTTATSVVDACAGGIVVLGVILAATRSIGRSIWLVACQSILAGIAAMAVGLSLGNLSLAAGGVAAVVAKGMVAPLILGTILRQSPVRTEREPYLGPRTAAIAAIAIAFVAANAVDGVVSSAGITASRALPAAVASILTGLLVVMTRRKGLSIVVGLLVFENGVALTAFALTYGMPLVVELGVLFDLLIAVVVAWVYTRRMLSTLGTTSTDRLRTLRG